MNEQAEGFWDRFLERVRKQGVKEPFGRWQVIRAEQFIKASGKPLADLTVEDVHRYLEEAGRKGNLKEWQFRQVVDATQNLLLTAEAACAEQVNWDYWRDSARSLKPDHATVARESGLDQEKIPAPDVDKPSLLDSIRYEHRQVISSLITEIRRRGYSIRTEQAYELWVCRVIAFCGKRYPRRLGAAEVVSFLEHIAVRRRVSVSTQNQALNALVFLYGQALNSPLGEFGNFVRAKRPKRLPTVLSRQEVGHLLADMEGVRYLMAALLYGTGMRLMECVRLRVQDVDFQYHQIIIRDGKGRKDRVVPLPQRLEQPLSDQLEAVRLLHQKDLAQGNGEVFLPEALARKYPKAPKEWG